ncbi:MAG: T9SS C-terminal target domain-containing protein [Calditrichaeota bacterium]|nr:MAG: T9SS C-terminal target domain-containing protein [Calditrichota bacterium]
MDNKMKIFTKTLVPVLALSFGIFTNCFAEYEEKITPNDIAAGHRYGFGIDIDGDYAISGAYEDGNGSAYIFKRSGTTWTQEAKIVASDGSSGDEFGRSVSIDGDFAIVGSRYDDDGGSDSGSAYIFKRSGTSWTEETKLTANDPDAGDRFGQVVAIEGNYAIISSHLDDDGGSSSGSAYIFFNNGTTWTQQAKLTASDANSNDYFGTYVSISGDYVLIGANGDDDGGGLSGSAYIFKRDGISWSEQAKLTANDAASGDSFGESVAISGEYSVIGAPVDDDSFSNSGSVYVFKRTGTSWSQQSKLNASDPAENDQFGKSVSIDGLNIVIGSSFDDDNALGSSGSAYIFSGDGSTWTQGAKITANDATVNARFGRSTAINGNYIVVGAYNSNVDGSSSGSAYIYASDGGDLPLAIELDSFEARQIENTIQLNWTTASETENEGFNVYRKTGNGNFVQIASYKGNSELLGTLNSTTSNNYTFVDNSELRNGETYTYYISDVETNGLETKHEKSAKTVRFVLNEETAQTKLDYVLAQNFPNPFNPSTQINFQIAKTQDVRLQIFNLKGKLVKELVNEKMNEGSHSAKWDGTDSFGNQVSSGTYFYKFSAGIFSQTNKMVLLK